MIIAENVLESALAQVFSGQMPGRRMSFHEIAQAWGRIGLRLSDLRDAIRAAVDQHDLRSCSGSSELTLELTPSGYQRYSSLRSRDDSATQWLQQHRQLLPAG